MIRVQIPPSLSCHAGGRQTLEVSGGTVRAALGQLREAYPELGRHLMREDGGLRSYVNVYVNNEDIRGLQGLDTPLREEDAVTLVPSIAGGS
jgi:sulfur-carrier protein